MNGAFSVSKEHPPQDGLTISTPVSILSETAVTWFSLGAQTDISAEVYDRPVIYIGMDGSGSLVTKNENQESEMTQGDCFIIESGTLCGTKTQKGFVYAEIMPMEGVKMNQAIKPGEIFQMTDLLPYENGSVVNMDVVSNDAMKFVLMSFDKGTGLSPHRAPGDALVFALDGKAVIGYEGKDYPIEAGQTFQFAKNGLHSITADEKFKMALLLMLK